MQSRRDRLRLLIRIGGCGSNLSGNGLREFPLQGPHVAQIAIVAIRPDMRVAQRVDELSRHMNSAPSPAHRPLQNPVHAEFPRDSRQRPT